MEADLPAMQKLTDFNWITCMSLNADSYKPNADGNEASSLRLLQVAGVAFTIVDGARVSHKALILYGAEHDLQGTLRRRAIVLCLVPSSL